MSSHPKKLIEVALPLEEINAACKADKGRAHGTIKNIHKWFAPMPLPAWRALLYAALIDDPEDDESRAQHLELIKRLVANGADAPSDEAVEAARENIHLQFPDGAPPVMDPFCGGGSTLVEAQRLGLVSYGSDLNPVPVLISRVLTELLPPIWDGQPVGGRSNDTAGLANGGANDQSLLELGSEGRRQYRGYEGLIHDFNYYSELVQRRVIEKSRTFYPSGEGETPIAWIWARTALCPNPACGISTVITTSWWLSKKDGERAWIEPAVQGSEVLLTVRQSAAGEAPEPPKSGRAVFSCVGCGSPLDEKYLRQEGQAGRLGLRMIAVVTDCDGRNYRAPSQRDVDAAALAVTADASQIPLSGWATKNFPLYGIDTWDKVYTDRQWLMLSLFADEVSGIFHEVLAAGGDEPWAKAVISLLGLAVGKLAQGYSSQALLSTRDHITSFETAFPRNDLPMTWSFYELYPIGSVGPTWRSVIATMSRALKPLPGGGQGSVTRADARVVHMPQGQKGLVATDPPYFDAIGYADLSDYFYLWHRRALRHVHPDLYATTSAPKQGELTAIASHHANSRDAARVYFVEGFTETFSNLQESRLPGLPLLVVYASKEQKGGRDEETRWASILTAMVNANLQITGTWPILGTTDRRMVGQGANAVATYVVMVARPRPEGASTCSLQDFNRALRRELKPAVHELQTAGILPVDLAQAAIGPGMQVYSRYRAVLDQSGLAVPVDAALRLINQALGEVLDEQEGELDPDSRFAVTWWSKYHWAEAPFGEADKLARPKGISVDDVVRASVAVYSRPGCVRLMGDTQLDRTWTPASDSRATAWEAVHHLADRLIDGGGVAEASTLMAELGPLRDQAQGLVYRLHAIAASQGWTRDQERYNALIGSWSDLLAQMGRARNQGDGLF